MTQDLYAGLGLVILSGIMTGCAVVPMKYASRWKWENIWLVCTAFALAALPFLTVLWTVPEAWTVYRSVNVPALMGAILFGLGWGGGSTLAGLGYTMLGIGLGTSIVLGLTAGLGALVPLMILFPRRLISPSSLVLYGGLLVMVVGVALSAQAGKRRQAQRPSKETTSSADIKAFGRGDIRIGLMVCVASAVLSSMFNLALIFADDIRVASLGFGASPMGAVNTLWLPVEIAGFVSNCLYCGYLLLKNKTWPLYFASGSGSHWLIGLLMGALWSGGISVYGLGAGRLGEMGAIAGFPVYMSMTMVTANTAGLLTGEWRGCSRTAYAYGFGGLIILVAAIVIIGVGNRIVG